MSSLCKFKDALGKPGEGVHSYRFLGVAIIDVILSVVLAIIISYTFSTSIPVSLITVLVLGVLSHRIFCVRTTIDKLIF